MSIATQPDVNGNITTSSSCVKCAGAQSDLSQSQDYGSPDLSKRVEVVFYYNSNRGDNGAFGFGRTLSVNLFLQLLDSTVTLTRSNGNEARYKDDGTGNFVSQSVGLRNTLTRDSANGLWKESTPDGRMMAYPIVAAGQISRIAWAQDSVGNRHTFAYDSNGLLQNIQDAFGRKTTFAYTISNLLDSITDFAGRVTRFTYNTTSVSGKPLLTQVTGPVGCQTAYEYDSQARLTAVVDPNGFRTSYTYDAQGRVVQRAVAGVGNDTYTYQADRTIWTDALKRTTTFIVDANSKLSGIINAAGQQGNITRNAQGQETQSQDSAGAVWQTTYDAQGNVISTTDPLGNVTRTERDSYGNPTRVTHPNGGVEGMVWGMAGSSFDTTGAKRRLQQLTDVLGNTTSYTYNVYGQLTSTTDALGNVTRRNYDSVGNLIRTTDALGNVTQFAYDTAGNQISRTDALGAVWSYGYDAADHLLSVTDPLKNVTQFAYDAVGNQIATVDALGNRNSTTYNAFDLPVTQTDASGNVTSYEYDAAGQSTAIVDVLGNRTSMEYNATGQVTATVDASGNRTILERDAMGRVSAIVDALGNRTIFEHDARDRQVAVVNALGQRATMTYDSMGNLTSQTDALGNVTSFAYDALGQQVTVVDALGHQNNRTQYDALGRKVALFDAFGNRTTYIYDAAGRCTSQTDAKGQTTSWTYDALNRVVQTLFSDGGRVNYTFDAVGRTVAMQDGTGTTSYSYNALGQETSVHYGSGHVISYAFDAVGNRTQMTDPDGSVTTYQHDTSGRLTQLTNPLGETTRLLYDVLGRIVQKNLANGVIETHAFDGAGQETSMQYRNSAGTLLASFTSVYGATGKRTKVTEADGSTTSYAYDAGGQLLSETRTGSNAYSISYSYDAVGNRTTKTENGLVTTYFYDQGNQLLREEVRDVNGNIASQSTAIYDLNGNVTQQVKDSQVTSLSWNPQNYLVGVTHADGTNESYTYCGEGIRRTKTNTEGFRRFIRDGQNILLEVQQDGSTLCRYTHENDDWGTLLSLHQGQMSRYFGFDFIGNTRFLSDENGAVSDSYLYSAFGQERQATGNSANHLRFGGQMGYYHDEANRLYVRARHLDVAAGRWLNRDPIGVILGEQNLFRFVGNDPALQVDPLGLYPIIPRPSYCPAPRPKPVPNCGGDRSARLTVASSTLAAGLFWSGAAATALYAACNVGDEAPILTLMCIAAVRKVALRRAAALTATYVATAAAIQVAYNRCVAAGGTP